MKSNSRQQEFQHNCEVLQVVEALIFAAEEPISADEIVRVLGEVSGQDYVSADDVEESVEHLNKHYDQADRAIRIEKWAGGFRMATIHAVTPYLKTYFEQGQEKRLSRSLLETLAIIAYKQPVTRPEVDFVRGVNSDYAVRKLMELALVDVVGRSEALGRPLLYGTTPRFLEQFGLGSLDDLPDMREMEELLDDPAFDKERAELLLLKQSDTPLPLNNEQNN